MKNLEILAVALLASVMSLIIPDAVEQRPGHGSNGNNHRPSSTTVRPGGNNSRPAPGNRPGNSAIRPGSGNHTRPMRPMPVPPPPYTVIRPAVPPVATILGISLGSALTSGMNTLLSSGYNIGGYDNNTVYLANVQEYGVIWTNAALYYNNGMLCAAQFETSALYPNQSVYNIVYNNISSVYGAPISREMNWPQASATWWGGNAAGYITLTYTGATNSYSRTAYYTTLVISAI